MAPIGAASILFILWPPIPVKVWGWHKLKEKCGEMEINNYEKGELEFIGLKVSWQKIDISTKWHKDGQEKFYFIIENGDKKESFEYFNSNMEFGISRLEEKANFSGIKQFTRLISRRFSWGGYDDVKNPKEFRNKRIWWLLHGFFCSISDSVSFSECTPTFGDFCDHYGYDEDSIKSLKTFEACREEEQKLNRLNLSEAQTDYFFEFIRTEEDKFSDDLKEAVEARK